MTQWKIDAVTIELHYICVPTRTTGQFQANIDVVLGRSLLLCFQVVGNWKKINLM